MLDFMKDIMKDSVTGNVDKNGKIKIDKPQDVIKKLNEECDFKSERVQFILTEPKQHPTKKGVIVSVIDLGGAAVMQNDSNRSEVFESILNVITDMKASLIEVEKAITLIHENPF